MGVFASAASIAIVVIAAVVATLYGAYKMLDSGYDGEVFGSESVSTVSIPTSSNPSLVAVLSRSPAAVHPVPSDTNAPPNSVLPISDALKTHGTSFTETPPVAPETQDSVVSGPESTLQK